MAQEDIELLQSQGITLTIEQIVTLNALGLRAERGPEAADLVRAPRVAWAGSTPIYEPTIAAERWLDTFGLHWWHGRSAVLCTAWACANCAAPGFFVDKTDERRVRSLIEQWQDGLDCTVGQLFTALSYVVDGADPDPSETPTAAPFAFDGCPYQSLISDALAAGLGVSAGELSQYPRRILADILHRWLLNQAALHGGDPAKLDARASTRAYVAYDDYLQTLKPKSEGEAADVQG